MFMYYKDKKYFLAIQDYKKGNRDSAIAILKMLAKKKFVKFEEDINGFITEIQTIAKSRKDEEMIAYTKDVGNKISIIDGNSHGKTSAYENVLETESECKAALRESLKNHEYVVVINNIINFVKENKNFHAAYGVLKMLHELPIKSDYFTKEEVVLLFVEKMNKIIVDDVNPVVEGVFFKKYSSVWTQFSSNEFKKYHKIVRNYTEYYTLSNYKKKNNTMNIKHKIHKKSNLTINEKYYENIELVYQNNYPFSFQKDRDSYRMRAEINNITYDGTGYTIYFEPPKLFHYNDFCHCAECKTMCVEIDGAKYNLNHEQDEVYIRSKLVDKIKVYYTFYHSTIVKFTKTIHLKNVCKQGKYYVLCSKKPYLTIKSKHILYLVLMYISITILVGIFAPAYLILIFILTIVGFLLWTLPKYFSK